EVGGGAAVRREVEEELVVALWTAQRRGGHAENVPAAQDHVARQALHRGPMLHRIAYDAALADVLAADLELGLDQGDDLSARGQDTEHRGKDFFERDERDVDDGERRLV